MDKTISGDDILEMSRQQFSKEMYLEFLKGRKQGALEELERLVDEVKKKDYCQDFLYYSILKRLKELKED
jgi:argonaute-like protein implicated in RNA metabolism and viral defense